VPDGRTCAQLSAAEKNAVSHRGRAVRAIAPEVAQILLG
jgi:XTP/dITP diphosphohydrolase